MTKKSAKYRILIVDDEENIIESVKTLLENSGVNMEIETACNGFEASVKIIRFFPHLVILDAVMPGCDGEKVCKLVKDNKMLRDIKILVFSGYPNEGRELIKLGAHKLIEKTSKDAEPEPFKKEIFKLLGLQYPA